MVQKHYSLELDVLASAGVDEIKRIAQDNVVYIDLALLELRAEKNSSESFGLRKVLDWTNKQMSDGRLRKEEDSGAMFIDPRSGGTICIKRSAGEGLEDVEDVEHVTRCPITTSRLLREGKRVSPPDFLRYSVDVLKSGLIDIEYHNSPDRISVDEVLEVAGLDELQNNQFVRVNNQLIYRAKRLVREVRRGSGRFEVVGEEASLERVNRDAPIKSKLDGLRARNLEQRLCWDQLTSKDSEVCFITGGSGSGKSVIAYAAALDLVLGTEKARKNGDVYKNITLFKTNDIIGGKDRELGFLPGDLFSKTFEQMKSFEDAHNFSGAGRHISFRDMLLHPESENIPGAGERKNHKVGEFYLPKRDAAITIEHLQYARGRTFEDRVVFVDEAQNYSPFEIQQLIERVGLGCKLFLVGDPEQVDNPRLSPEFNGLVYAAHILSRGPRTTFMHFDRNYRSQSAEIMRSHQAPRVL